MNNTKITAEELKESMKKAHESGETISDILHENADMMKAAGLSFSAFAETLPEESRKEVYIFARRQDKAIVSNTNNFLNRIKSNDSNKYYHCKAFMQSDITGHADTINFKRGTLSYIGAMTHRGKTTALISIALDAILQNHKVYFVTTEETPDQIFIRMIKAIMFTEYNRIIAAELKNTRNIDALIERELKDYEKDLFTNEPQNVKQSIFRCYEILEGYLQADCFSIIDHTRQRSFEELQATLKTLDNNTVVMLDYIQHVKKPEHSGSDNRQVIIQNESQQLADLAGHKDLIIIAGGQFNRKGSDKEKESDKYKPDWLDPTLFRESGDIEQDADKIIGIGQQLCIKADEKGYKTKRFYEVLKQRGFAHDTNKYLIDDNSAFSLYSCSRRGDSLQYFEIDTPTSTDSRHGNFR